MIIPYVYVVCALYLAPFQHLQPGGRGVFHGGNSTMFLIRARGGRFPGLKPRPESCSPFGAKNLPKNNRTPARSSNSQLTKHTYV
jgi:hypothetical protein